MTAPATVEIRPQIGPQEAFLASLADVAILGGSAGAGKTYGLLLEPLRHLNNRFFGGVIFRRTYPEITNEGGMWDESEVLYPLLGGKPTPGHLSWAFPQGMTIRFAHLQHPNTVYNWHGAQVPFIGFDELTLFAESQFWYMLSRNRSATAGIRPYVRATCNADADSWVAQLIAWWIDQETGYAIPERSGVVRFFTRLAGELIWGDTREEVVQQLPKKLREQEEKADRDPRDLVKSLTFIVGRLKDNPALTKKDPGYRANLMALTLVERERLLGDEELGGNWKIRHSAGKVYNRSWYEIVDAVPPGGIECRFWDFASTEAELEGDDPDLTAGVKVRKVDGTYYIIDMFAEALGPALVERTFINITRQDALLAKSQGIQYLVRWEQEPASAGKRESYRFVRKLAGYDARGIPAQGDKLLRGRGFAAQSEIGNVKVLRAPWNEAWLNHMHDMPDGDHDDIHDGTVGSFNELVDEVRRTIKQRRG